MGSVIAPSTLPPTTDMIQGPISTERNASHPDCDSAERSVIAFFQPNRRGPHASQSIPQREPDKNRSKPKDLCQSRKPQMRENAQGAIGRIQGVADQLLIARTECPSSHIGNATTRPESNGTNKIRCGNGDRGRSQNLSSGHNPSSHNSPSRTPA